MRFSLRVNNDLTIDRFREIAEAAEHYGFDQLWVSNDLYLRPAAVLLTAAALHTERISLGCGIFNPYSIHPAEIAMIAAGLQEVSGGRFLLGIGAGAAEFLESAGIPRTKPLTRTRDAVLELRALLDGERPSSVPDLGGTWTEEGYLRVPVATTPIYVGAMGPRMQVMAGEVADGVLPLLFPPEHFAVAYEHVGRGASSAGRGMEDIDLAACIWVSIDADADRARRALAEKIAYYGPSLSPALLEPLGVEEEDFDGIRAAMAQGRLDDAVDQVTEPMLQIGIAGNANDVRRRCEWLIEAGARHLSFGPPLGPDPLAAVKDLGEKVLHAFA